jgi:nitrite reductase/ring-hydroxylating ferredoxin subunit
VVRYTLAHSEVEISPLFSYMTTVYFIHNELTLRLEDIPLHAILNVCLHKDAPSHFGLQEAQYLNRCRSDLRIGHGGTHAWPSRSP